MMDCAHALAGKLDLKIPVHVSKGRTTMPTDIGFVPGRKGTPKEQSSKDAFTDLTTICVWSIVGLVLVTLLVDSGMTPELVATMLFPG